MFKTFSAVCNPPCGEEGKCTSPDTCTCESGWKGALCTDSKYICTYISTKKSFTFVLYSLIVIKVSIFSFMTNLGNKLQLKKQTQAVILIVGFATVSGVPLTMISIFLYLAYHS